MKNMTKQKILLLKKKKEESKKLRSQSKTTLKLLSARLVYLKDTEGDHKC